MKIEEIKEKFTKGTTVLLKQMGPDPHPIPDNSYGLVTAVDDIGTVHCLFQNGRSLGLIPDVDNFDIVEDKELIQIASIGQGQCPYCGSLDVEFGSMELMGEMVYYPVHCNLCKRDSQEWYKLKFAGFNVGDDCTQEAIEGQYVLMSKFDNRGYIPYN